MSNIFLTRTAGLNQTNAEAMNKYKPQPVLNPSDELTDLLAKLARIPDPIVPRPTSDGTT